MVTCFGPMARSVVKKCVDCGYLMKTCQGISLGPLGLMLKKTVIDSWLRSVQSEGALLCCLPDNLVTAGDNGTNAMPSSELVSAVNQSFRLLKSELFFDGPLCVAAITRKAASPEKQKHLADLLNPLPHTTCCELFFVPHAKLLGRMYDMWFRKRLQWWMQVSNWSRNLQPDFRYKHDMVTIEYSSDLCRTKVGEQNINDSKVLELERIQKLYEFHLMDTKRSIVHCSFDVESTVAALLTDSLQFEAGDDGTLDVEAATFNLDAFMVPYKVVVLELQSTDQFREEIHELCNKLCYSFLLSGVSHLRFRCRLKQLVLPNVSEMQRLPQWQRYRRIGVTRGVVVSDKTVQTGLVDFLHRSFEFHEEIPIAHVKPRIVKEIVEPAVRGETL